MNEIKLGMRVKVTAGPMEGGVGEVHTLDEEAGSAGVYLSGFVHDLEVQGMYDLPIDELAPA